MSDETAQTGAEVVPEVEAQAEAGSEATTEQSETPKAEQVRDEKGRFVPQERVNEITRARREAERRADSLERELAFIRQQQPAQHQPQSEAPPTFEQFNFDQVAFQRAMAEYVSRQAESVVDRRWREQEAQRVRQQVAQTFGEKSRQYEAEHPEYQADLAQMDSTVKFRDEIVEAIAFSDHGPAVAHYLSKHLDEADRIARLPLHLAAVQLGRIEAQVAAPKSKPVTKAPDPVPTVGGGSRTSKNPDDMTDAEFAAWRRRQIAQRR